MDTGESISARRTLRRGVELSPELREGIGGTVALAVVATLGRVVIPIAVQQTLDRGLGADGPDVGFVTTMAVLAAVAIVVTGGASYLMTSRLFTAAERGLATLRVKAFRHVHDLPLLTQSSERRGALVARVTSDVDQVSQFLIFGGIIAVVSVGQILVATVVMAVYSWQLTLVVWICFLPLFLSLRYFQRKLSDTACSISIPTASRSRRSPTAATAIRLSCAIDPTTPAGQIGAPNLLLRIGRPATPIEFISSRATCRAAPLARRLSIAGKENDSVSS
jgi:ABC-type multidrug transport system fused ATPase/permease subunit